MTTPLELATNAEALMTGTGPLLPRLAQALELVPQLAAALREACEWVSDLAEDDEPGVMCRRCGTFDRHHSACPKTLARDFLARNVEVPHD